MAALSSGYGLVDIEQEIYEILCELRKIDEAWEATIPSIEEIDSGDCIHRHRVLDNTARQLLEIDYDMWVYSDAQAYGDKLAELLSMYKNPKFNRMKQVWEKAKADYYADIAE